MYLDREDLNLHLICREEGLVGVRSISTQVGKSQLVIGISKMF